jgi:acyl-CoA synthetase (AMP-forming)/AMP-acid ligase II
LSWNCPEYFDVVGAAMKGGFILSPYNPRLKVEELQYLIDYSDAKILFVGPEQLEMVHELKKLCPKVKTFISLVGSAPGAIPHSDLLGADSTEPDTSVKEDDPFAIFYTSGTTGVPRGALYTHRRKMEDSRNFAMGLTAEVGNRQVLCLPLFHVAAMSYSLGFFYAGGLTVIMSQRAFDPAATLQAIQDEKATDIHLVPTHLVSILALPNVREYDLTSLKRIWYAASPMPVELLKRAMEIFGPVFIQAYGQTESGPLVTYLSKADHDVLDKPPQEQRVLASIGQPCAGIHVRIVDKDNHDVKPGEIGEIIVESKSLMVQYWQKPEETKQAMVDGWLYTGDLGYYDNKAYIYLVDRKKEMVITGGENVYPREIEEVLYGHPAVEELAVIGVDDPYWVEKVHAVVVLKKGKQATEKELIGFCKQRLAHYKAPKSVEFVESLPKNPQGKINKRFLKELYAKRPR